MKKGLLALVIIILGLISCGDDSREEDLMAPQSEAVNDSIPTLSGEFIFLADAAVLKGRDFIYGVQLDSTARNLVKRVEPFKQDDFDMVPVTVRAKIIPNPRQNEWDEVIQIREVLELPEENTSPVKKTSN